MEKKTRKRNGYRVATGSPQGMAIHAACLEKGTSLTAWCKTEGIHPKIASDILIGHSKGMKPGGRAIKEKLAAAFGVTFDETPDA